MKLFAVAFKDMRQSFRSLSAIMFMFVVPILVTGLFYFMFGGIGDDGSFDVPGTAVVVVNLDEGSLPEDASLAEASIASPGQDLSRVNSMGDLLVQILSEESFSDLLTLSEAADEAAAREAVDDQIANVAIIIPPNFTDALMLEDENAVLELYKDPTLTLGPGIVESITAQFADSFAGTKIGTSVVMTQLGEAQATITAEMVGSVAAQFAAAAFGQSEASPPLVTVRSPSGAESENNLLAEILGQIMAGMMTFFAFFTGSTMLQSILVEEENGTLPRLFTTPTKVGTILGGKLAAAVATLIVQLTVLMLFGSFVFSIKWGGLLQLALAASGIILISAATGLFLVSWLKNTRQGGAVYGGLLTLTGMVGMIRTFGGIELTPTIQTISLLVPQGWAIQGLQIAMDGGSAADMLPSLAGLFIWVAVFAIVGQYRLQRRFA